MKISTTNQVIICVSLMQNSAFPLSGLVIIIGKGSVLMYVCSTRAALIHCKVCEQPRLRGVVV